MPPKAAKSIPAEAAVGGEQLATILKGMESQLQELQLLKPMQRSIDEINSSLKEIKGRMDKLEARQTSLEENFDQQVTVWHSSHRLLSAQMDKMDAFMRRRNLKLVGFKSITGHSQKDLTSFASDFFKKTLLLDDSYSLGIETVNAIYQPKVDGGSTMLIVQFLNIWVRDEMLRLSRDTSIKAPIKWEGATIRIFADYNPELLKKRAKFQKAKELARAQGIAYFTRFPAIFCLEMEDEIKKFQEPKNAILFLEGLKSNTKSGDIVDGKVDSDADV